MSSRWTGFFIWALVAATTAFWAMGIFASTRPLPPTAVAPPAPLLAEGPMPRLFGAAPVADDTADAPPPESDRFQLVGVIAPRSGAVGAYALVATDGQPAKPFRVGATVDGDTTLLAVARRTADFGPAGGPTAFTLQLPEPAAAETGTLPDAVSGAGAVPAVGGGVVMPLRGAPQAPGFPPRAVGGSVAMPGRLGPAERSALFRPGGTAPIILPNGRAAPTAGMQPVPAAADPDQEDQ